MAPKAKVVLLPQEKTARPSVRRNPASSALEMAGTPANSSDLHTAAAVDLPPRKSVPTSVSNSFAALQVAPSQQHLSRTAVPAEMVRKNDSDDDDSSEESSGEYCCSKEDCSCCYSTSDDGDEKEETPTKFSAKKGEDNSASVDAEMSTQKENSAAVNAEFSSVLGPAKHPRSSAEVAYPAPVDIATITDGDEQFSAATRDISDPVVAVSELDAAAGPIDATENEVGEKLDFDPVNIENGKLLIAPSDEDISRCKKKWHKCLVGYFVGSALPENIVKEHARQMWGKKGLVSSFERGGFFFFRFDSELARKKVLETGPHFMFKHQIILQQWEKKMRLVKERQRKISLWVKFYNIPLELWSYRGLSLVASAVGRPLYLDEATKKMDRLSFARVCVEADAERPLPNEMFIDYGDGGEYIKIEAKYDSRPPHCVKCKVFRHSCDKRTVEKTNGASYAEVAGKVATPSEWPSLNNSDMPPLPSPKEPATTQQQQSPVGTQQKPHNAAKSGQQQLQPTAAANTAPVQQKSAQKQQVTAPSQHRSERPGPSQQICASTIVQQHQLAVQQQLRMRPTQSSQQQKAQSHGDSDNEEDVGGK